jgi:hypothetical protein
MKFKVAISLTFALYNFVCTAQNVFNKRFTYHPTGLEASGNLAIMDDTIYCVYSTTLVGGHWEMVYQKYDETGDVITTGHLAKPNTLISTQEVSNAILDMGDSLIHMALLTQDGLFSETLIQCINKHTLDTLWTKTLGDGSAYNFALNEIFQVGDSLVLIGETDILDNSPGTSVDLVIVKCDLEFNIGWQKIHGGSNRELGFGSLATTDGGFLICGITKSNSLDGEYDGVAYKVDSLGNLDWTFQDKNLHPDYPLHFENTLDGYVGTGFNVDSAYEYTSGNFNYFGKPFAIKLDLNGNEVWRKYYSPPHGKGNMYGTWQIRKTIDGNYVILGMHGHGGADSDIPYRGRGFLMKITPDGDSLWYREYKNLLNENTYNYMRDVVVHPDGGYVMTGFLWAVGPPDTGYQDMWLVKANCLGFDHEPIAAATWNADDNFKIILDNNSQYFGNCIINWGDGTSNYIYEGYDTLISHVYDDDAPYIVEVIAFACGSYDTSYVTVYPQVLSLDETESNQLIRLYPNPASDGFYVSVQNSESSIEHIYVFDLQGNVVNTSNLSNKNNVYYLETSDLANGIYLIHLRLADSTSQVLRLNVMH